jgi:hypothetical protein
MPTPPRIRARPPVIAHFEPGFTVVPGRAQIDRMKLTLRNGYIFASSSSLTTVLRRNGAIRRKHTDCYLKFTYVSGAILTATIIARRPEANSRNWSLTVELGLNVTRYAVATGCVQQRISPSEANLHQLEVEALDANNNFVPDRLLPRARILEWPVKSAQCFEWAFREVQRVLETVDLQSARAGSATNTTYRAAIYRDQWALSSLEVYWEARCADAISTVRHVEELGSEIARELTSSIHETVHPNSGSLVNARVLKFALGRQTVSLVVYAKLLDRIRLEVRYASNARSHLRQLSEVPANISFTELIRATMENAAERTNTLLHSLWARNFEAPHALLRLSMFLHGVSMAFAGNSFRIQTFLCAIVTNGRFQRTSDSEFGEGIDWLVRRNFLRVQNSTLRTSRRTYAASRPYASALRQLRRTHTELIG